jgi:hypothetical protein
MTLSEQLKAIKPGKTYPRSVDITEMYDGEEMKIRFLLQSYCVGMYCAIHAGPGVPCQTGDHNNRNFVTKLKKDVVKAIQRGAKVEIGTIYPCVLSVEERS